MSTTTRKRRARRASDRWPRPMWTVEVAGHDVERWHIPAQTVELGADSAECASAVVVKWAHLDAGVPPLRSMLAVSMAYTTAKPARSPTTRSEVAA
jgi:hypothetical protein